MSSHHLPLDPAAGQDRRYPQPGQGIPPAKTGGTPGWDRRASECSSRSRIWLRGGPRFFFRDFADVAKRSQVSKANNIIFQYKRIWEF